MTEYVDSFGGYVTGTGLSPGPSQSSMITRWQAFGNGNLQIVVLATAGKRGNPALNIPFGGALYKTLSHQTTFIVGFNVNINTISGVGDGDLIRWHNNDQILVSLRVNLDGSITVYGANNTGNILFTSAAGLLASLTDQYIELSATISGTSNMTVAAEVWIDGVSAGSGSVLTGLATTDLTNQTATFNRIGLLSGVVTNGQAVISDFYINNGSGLTNTDPFGTVEIDAYPLPDGDLTPLAWSPLGGGGPHFSQINELPATADSSYVASSTPGQKDCYSWQDVVTFSGTVKSVQVSFMARSTDEGIRSFQGTIGALGAEEQTTEFGLGNSYLYYSQAFDIDPATGVPWTIANFNVKPFGIGLVQ